MKDRTRLGTPNKRRANRLQLQRPMRILSPITANGEMVDISAVGVLVRLEAHGGLARGQQVILEIPHLEGEGTLVRQGRVVRVEPDETGLTVAIELE